MSRFHVNVFPWIVFLISIQLWCFLGSEVRSQSSWTGGSSGSGWGNEWSGNRWPGSVESSKGWKLGVEGTNTDVGVVIRNVSPNSAAARIGMRNGDTIVCVDGDQVGLVGGKVFDIGEELNHHADSGGRVRLLVQQGRTLKLSSIQVQLDDQQGGLSGTLLVRDGRLPADAIVTVQLENVTRPHFAVRNGQQTFRVPAYSQGSIPFQISYDPRYVSASDTYRVRASITSNGTTIYETPRPEYVLTQGYPSSVQLVLSPAAFAFAGEPSNVVPVGKPGYDDFSQRVDAAYQRYLGRRPTTVELGVWQSIPDIDRRIDRLPLELMASQEFYDRSGNNNAVWLKEVFTRIIGRLPTPTELDQWMRRFAEVRYSRMEILNEMYQARQG